MKDKFLPKIPFIIVLLITLIFANLQINKRSGSRTDICFNICGDARGYYAWLPAIFIYHDLNFHFFEETELKDSTCGRQVGLDIQDYRYNFEGKSIDKYYPGVSFMMLPFFMAAHVATVFFTTYPPNGYSPLYFKIMALSGIFYNFLGILLLLKILGRLGLNTLQKSLTILLVNFGSNAMYYAIDAPLYSHIYSFTLIAAFIYLSLRLRDSITAKNILWLSFITGFIMVARPVNISVALILPFVLSGKIKLLRDYFKANPARYLQLLPVFMMPLILVTLYKISVGHFVVYSYGNEHFDFLHPHFWGFLFTYNNGVVPYTPLLLMPLIFLFAWYNPENKNIIAGLIITIIATIYIHSSWWAWNYGFSFGARTMLDFTPLFGMIVGLSLKQKNVKRYYYLLPAYLLCCALTMLLYHQKSHGGYMNQYPITDYWKAVTNS